MHRTRSENRPEPRYVESVIIITIGKQTKPFDHHFKSADNIRTLASCWAGFRRKRRPTESLVDFRRVLRWKRTK